MAKTVMNLSPWLCLNTRILVPTVPVRLHHICTIFYNWLSLYLIVEIPAFYHCLYKRLLEFCTLTEMGGLGKVKQDALFFVKIILLLGFLCFIMCSLDFLRTVSRLLGGKTAGEAFASNKILTITEDFIGCKRFASFYHFRFFWTQIIVRSWHALVEY